MLELPTNCLEGVMLRGARVGHLLGPFCTSGHVALLQGSHRHLISLRYNIILRNALILILAVRTLSIGQISGINTCITDFMTLLVFLVYDRVLQRCTALGKSVPLSAIYFPTCEYSRGIGSGDNSPLRGAVPPCASLHGGVWVGLGQGLTQAGNAGQRFLPCTALVPRPGCPVPRPSGLGGNVCPARARRATFLLTIPTSARDLPSNGEGPPNRP